MRRACTGANNARKQWFDGYVKQQRTYRQGQWDDRPGQQRGIRTGRQPGADLIDDQAHIQAYDDRRGQPGTVTSPTRKSGSPHFFLYPK